MYYNNNDNRKDSDLKFIPLSITEAFTEKDSSWFPIIDMALPAFSEIPNSFAFNFNTPMDNSNIQKSSLNTLDYVQSNNSNLQNNMQQIPNMQQNQNVFEKSFDLDYPSEILNEELKSYNKNEKCKSNTGSNSNLNNQNQNLSNQNLNNQNQNLSNQNLNNQNQNLSNQNLNNQNQNLSNQNQNLSNQNLSNQNLGNPNLNNQSQNLGNQNLNTGNINNMVPISNEVPNTNTQNVNSRGYIEEPIHMELLRGLDFENLLDKSYRGEEGDQIEEVDRIFRLVKSDSSIIDTFKAYNIPRPIYELIIKKIIKISLDNLSNKWRD